MKHLWCLALAAALASSVSDGESLTREQIQQRLASPPADFKNLEAPGANLSGIDFAGADWVIAAGAIVAAITFALWGFVRRLDRRPPAETATKPF